MIAVFADHDMGPLAALDERKFASVADGSGSSRS
jgi:hypothetical protein